MELIMYNAGEAPPWVFDSFFERGYISGHIMFNVWSKRSADKIISISKTAEVVLDDQQNLFYKGTWRDFKKVLYVKGLPVWWFALMIRNIIRFWCKDEFMAYRDVLAKEPYDIKKSVIIDREYA